MRLAELTLHIKKTVCGPRLCWQYPPGVCCCQESRRGTIEPNVSHNCGSTQHVQAVDGLPCLHLMAVDVPPVLM